MNRIKNVLLMATLVMMGTCDSNCDIICLRFVSINTEEKMSELEHKIKVVEVSQYILVNGFLL